MIIITCAQWCCLNFNSSRFQGCDGQFLLMYNPGIVLFPPLLLSLHAFRKQTCILVFKCPVNGLGERRGESMVGFPLVYLHNTLHSVNTIQGSFVKWLGKRQGENKQRDLSLHFSRNQMELSVAPPEEECIWLEWDIFTVRRNTEDKVIIIRDNLFLQSISFSSIWRVKYNCQTIII